MSVSTVSVGVGKTDSTVTATIEPTGANQELTVKSADELSVMATIIGTKITVSGVKEGGPVKIMVSSNKMPSVKTELMVTATA